jgi:hypothetical protein
VNEPEVRKLFMLIQNVYSGFIYDSVKVVIWQDLLHDVPFELAQRNLRTHIMNTDEKFPPHPGVIARRPEQEARGRCIPNAAETRKMLKEMDEQAARSLASPVPEHLRGRFKIEPPRIESATSGTAN